MRQGVRQGGVLSAYLFTYYIDNILKCVFKEDVGCRIGINKFNILAYADDIVLMSPSAGGLRILLNVINDCINDHKLLINVIKTKVMVFKNKRKYVFNDLSFYLNGTILENVSSFKYLGYILNFDLDDSLDILKGLSSFNKSFGFLFRKFYSLEPRIFYSLFLSFCSSFYGSELWFYRFKCRESFNKLAVSYHSALKKILCLPKFYSNHVACSALDAYTFKHFINMKILRFAFWLKNCQSLCFYSLKHYFFCSSSFIDSFNQTWQEVYEVGDVLNNDVQAILARIKFVQDREPCSMFVGF